MVTVQEGAEAASFTVDRLLRTGRQALVAAGTDAPLLDASLLLAALLGLSRATLLARPDLLVAPESATHYLTQIDRRIAGEPLAYLLGQREFYGLDLWVDRRVLVPRPETELLVEEVVRSPAMRALPAPHVIDVGTGSGAIAIAIAATVPTARVVGVDLSADALAVARANIERHRLGDRVQLVQGWLLDWLYSQRLVTAIVANLPYLRPDQANASIAHEPALALYAGDDGLALYRRLLPRLPYTLEPGGLFVAEIDPGQRAAMLALVELATGGWPCHVVDDLAGWPRMVVVARPA
jgi:release factor glutamine methyltransferase